MKQYEVIVESATREIDLILENVETTAGNLLHGTAIGYRTKEGDLKKYNTPLDFKTSCRFTMLEFSGVLE